METVPQKKNFRVEIEGSLRAEWEAMLRDRRIDQTDAALQLIRFIVSLPPEAQSMVLGQLPATDDLIEIVLNKLKDAGNVAGAIGPQDRRAAANETIKKAKKIK